ncbi:hypothetical protein ONZ51_g4284 [Trametes cubensis]|uniref:Uncharacterized protein n=1 Tax=Trametes cubensis TaxID=1111947 RepID=A0AAD7XC56_9APHY|nr:hypothetical protein ONZ51_g4284 [Trametes cubensis]
MLFLLGRAPGRRETANFKQAGFRLGGSYSATVPRSATKTPASNDNSPASQLKQLVTFPLSAPPSNKIALREFRSTLLIPHTPTPYALGFSTLALCACDVPGFASRHYSPSSDADRLAFSQGHVQRIAHSPQCLA